MADFAQQPHDAVPGRLPQHRYHHASLGCT